MGPYGNLTSNATTPATNGTPLLDKLNNDNAMALMADARIVLAVLHVLLGIILKAYQIRIAKRTLAVLRDIKDGRKTEV